MAGDKTGAEQRHRTIELHLPSELGWERTAMDVAESVARRMGFPPDRVEDIKTAVSEATTNAIEHGNALDASQRVQIVLIPEGESLEIEVLDGVDGAASGQLACLMDGELVVGWGIIARSAPGANATAAAR